MFSFFKRSKTRDKQRGKQPQHQPQPPPQALQLNDAAVARYAIASPSPSSTEHDNQRKACGERCDVADASATKLPHRTSATHDDYGDGGLRRAANESRSVGEHATSATTSPPSAVSRAKCAQTTLSVPPTEPPPPIAVINKHSSDTAKSTDHYNHPPTHQSITLGGFFGDIMAKGRNRRQSSKQQQHKQKPSKLPNDEIIERNRCENPGKSAINENESSKIAGHVLQINSNGIENIKHALIAAADSDEHHAIATNTVATLPPPSAVDQIHYTVPQLAVAHNAQPQQRQHCDDFDPMFKNSQVEFIDAEVAPNGHDNTRTHAHAHAVTVTTTSTVSGDSDQIPISTAATAATANVCAIAEATTTGSNGPTIDPESSATVINIAASAHHCGQQPAAGSNEQSPRSGNVVAHADDHNHHQHHVDDDVVGGAICDALSKNSEQKQHGCESQSVRAPPPAPQKRAEKHAHDRAAVAVAGVDIDSVVANTVVTVDQLVGAATPSQTAEIADRHRPELNDTARAPINVQLQPRSAPLAAVSDFEDEEYGLGVESIAAEFDDSMGQQQAKATPHGGSQSLARTHSHSPHSGSSSPTPAVYRTPSATSPSPPPLYSSSPGRFDDRDIFYEAHTDADFLACASPSTDDSTLFQLQHNLTLGDPPLTTLNKLQIQHHHQQQQLNQQQQQAANVELGETHKLCQFAESVPETASTASTVVGESSCKFGDGGVGAVGNNEGKSHAETEDDRQPDDVDDDVRECVSNADEPTSAAEAAHIIINDDAADGNDADDDADASFKQNNKQQHSAAAVASNDYEDCDADTDVDDDDDDSQQNDSPDSGIDVVADIADISRILTQLESETLAAAAISCSNSSGSNSTASPDLDEGADAFSSQAIDNCGGSDEDSQFPAFDSGRLLNHQFIKNGGHPIDLEDTVSTISLPDIVESIGGQSALAMVSTSSSEQQSNKSDQSDGGDSDAVNANKLIDEKM